MQTMYSYLHISLQAVFRQNYAVII